uniref:Uncharacterized protein LOC111104622 isoform X2 n=1 Tax=Crassostrea virginica TaxID=6565 RepID=A0A8B8ASH5_CRAVI|nr:uncharacterized protein LOC111104622 isoform X2 [Crassostrea virginica]
MKSFLCAVSLYGAVVIFTKTNGGCPTEDENNTMRRCDGSYKSGRYVYVDFYQIKHPCTCTLKASFNGDIIVTAKSDGYYECESGVTVSLVMTSSVFNCESTYPSSMAFTVVNNETIVNVKAEYIQSYTSGGFPVCLGINENGGLGGIVSVQCGNVTTTGATTPYTSTSISTTSPTTLSPIESSKPSLEVISSKDTDVSLPETEQMTTNTNHVSDKITNRPISTNISTPKCTSAFDANNLALQMTLACFVVISVVLAALSVYLYIQLKFRIQSMNEEGNTCSKDSQRTRSETITDNYTELGLENVTAEPENQYESLARQENYTNLNML